MADLTQAICESLGGKSPKLDQVIDDTLGGDVWFDKYKKAVHLLRQRRDKT